MLSQQRRIREIKCLLGATHIGIIVVDLHVDYVPYYVVGSAGIIIIIIIIIELATSSSTRSTVAQSQTQQEFNRFNRNVANVATSACLQGTKGQSTLLDALLYHRPFSMTASSAPRPVPRLRKSKYLSFLSDRTSSHGDDGKPTGYADRAGKKEHEGKPTKGASSPGAAAASPPSPPRRLRQNSSAKLSTLLREMDELIALDRILDARGVVDKIRHVESRIGLAPHGLISPDTCSKMEAVVSESDHIRHLLSDLRSDDTWHLVKQTKAEGGITVHYRNEEGSPIHSVKTHTILEGVNATGFVQICSLFLESDLFPLWAPGNIIESSEVLASPSKFRQIIHQKLNFGKYSPVSPRDAIVEGRGYHLADDNAVLILATSVSESPYCAVPPKSKSHIRIDLQQAFYIELLPSDRVLFRQISHDDLKLRFMPAFVINWISQGAMPVGFIHSLKSVLRRYESTEFYQRMQQRRDLYGEIEERVHKELVSKVSRMDTGITVESDISENDEDSNAMSQSRERTLRDACVTNGPLAAGSGNMSAFATACACLACIFIARFGVRLSLFWAVMPRNTQIGIILCILSLPLFMFVGSKSNKGPDDERVIRIRKLDGSLEPAEMPDFAESPRRLLVPPPDDPTPMKTPRKKLNNLELTDESDAISDISNRTRTKKSGKIQILKAMRRKRHPAPGASKIHYGYKIW